MRSTSCPENVITGVTARNAKGKVHFIVENRGRFVKLEKKMKTL